MPIAVRESALTLWGRSSIQPTTHISRFDTKVWGRAGSNLWRRSGHAARARAQDSSFAIKLLHSFTHSYSNTYGVPSHVLGPKDIEMTNDSILRKQKTGIFYVILSLLEVCDSLMNRGHMYGARVDTILLQPLYFCCLKQQLDTILQIRPEATTRCQKSASGGGGRGMEGE